jgi:hypothetical protein
MSQGRHNTGGASMDMTQIESLSPYANPIPVANGLFIPRSESCGSKAIFLTGSNVGD